MANSSRCFMVEGHNNCWRQKQFCCGLVMTSYSQTFLEEKFGSLQSQELVGIWKVTLWDCG